MSDNLKDTLIQAIRDKSLPSREWLPSTRTIPIDEVINLIINAPKLNNEPREILGDEPTIRRILFESICTPPSEGGNIANANVADRAAKRALDAIRPYLKRESGCVDANIVLSRFSNFVHSLPQGQENNGLGKSDYNWGKHYEGLLRVIINEIEDGDTK